MNVLFLWDHQRGHVVAASATNRQDTPRAIVIADGEDDCRVVAASEVSEVAGRMQTEEFCGR